MCVCTTNLGGLQEYYQHPDALLHPEASGTGQALNKFPEPNWQSSSAMLRAEITSYKTEVLTPIETWLNTYAEMRKRYETSQENNLVQDYYCTKLAKFKAAQKKETAASKEKLERNETKHSTAKQLFDKSHSALVEEMTTMQKARFVAFNGIAKAHMDRVAARSKGLSADGASTSLLATPLAKIDFALDQGPSDQVAAPVGP